MKSKLLAGGYMLLNLFLVGAVSAQNTTISCQALLKVAVDTARESCAGTGPDQICFGSAMVSGVPVEGVTDFQFDGPGSVASVDRMQSLQVRTGDFAASEYGIAQMNLRIRPDMDDSATLVMFGDVDLADAVEAVPTLQMTVNQGINIRVGPGDYEGLIGSLTPGTTVTATGRALDATGQQWIRIHFADHLDGMGWVVSWALNSSDDRSVLNVVQRGDRIFQPMQVVTLRTGYSDAPCQPAPDSGLLIQTPPQYSFSIIINGVEVILNGTTFLQTVDGVMQLNNLEGSLTARAAGRQQLVPTGTLTQVPLDDAGQAAGTPSFPDPYMFVTLERLPYDLLPSPVQLDAPLTVAEILEFFTPPEEELLQAGIWMVSGEPAGCFPGPTQAPVFSSDYFLGTGVLTIAEDYSSLMFTGGPGGTSTHRLTEAGTYTFRTETFVSETVFTTRILDPQRMTTDVFYSYVSGDGNCVSSAVWTWQRIGDLPTPEAG